MSIQTEKGVEFIITDFIRVVIRRHVLRQTTPLDALTEIPASQRLLHSMIVRALVYLYNATSIMFTQYVKPTASHPCPLPEVESLFDRNLFLLHLVILLEVHWRRLFIALLVTWLMRHHWFNCAHTHTRYVQGAKQHCPVRPVCCRRLVLKLTVSDKLTFIGALRIFEHKFIEEVNEREVLERITTKCRFFTLRKETNCAWAYQLSGVRGGRHNNK